MKEEREAQETLLSFLLCPYRSNARGRACAAHVRGNVEGLNAMLRDCGTVSVFIGSFEHQHRFPRTCLFERLCVGQLKDFKYVH